MSFGNDMFVCFEFTSETYLNLIFVVAMILKYKRNQKSQNYKLTWIQHRRFFSDTYKYTEAEKQDILGMC